MAEQHLTVQVALVHHVELDESQGADPGRGQVEAERRAQSAGADGQHLGGLQAALPLDPHLGHDEVAAVLADLGGVELRQAGRAAALPIARAAAAGNRGDDGERVAGGDFGGAAFQVAHVLVVEENVDEAAQSAVGGVQVGLEARVLADQIAQRLVDRGARDLDVGGLAGEAPQGCRNLDCQCHVGPSP
jgi:hypothetical protein